MINANIFIDWDSARRIIRPKWDRGSGGVSSDLKTRERDITNCFSQLQEKVVAQLQKLRPDDSIKITKSRVYHGWHRGKTMTEDRRAWDDARLKLRAVVNKKISFLPDVEFGNVLSCGGSRQPLFDTLRTRVNGELEQKMVDTALTADLLSFCRTASRHFQRGTPPDSLAIVIGDDDDLLPGVFVAEKWGVPVYVLRVTREEESKYVNSQGITFKI